jgi:hypothetical protein
MKMNTIGINQSRSMKSLFSFFSLLFVALAVGCATTTSEDQATASNVDVSHYRTFALGPLPNRGPASDPGAPARLGAAARDAVVQSLNAKGFHEAPEDQADFIVNFVGEFLPDPLIESSERRILTINLVDRATHQEVWSTYRSRSSSKTYSPDELRALVVSMLAPVPTAKNLQGK